MRILKMVTIWKLGIECEVIKKLLKKSSKNLSLPFHIFSFSR
jgi:hypothetical protein